MGLGCPRSNGVDMGCPRPGWAWTWDVHGAGDVVDIACPYPLHTMSTPTVGVEIPCPHPCCADISCIMLWTSHVHTSAWTSHVHALRLGVDMGCPHGQGVDMKCPRHLSMGWVWTWDVHTARIAGGRGQGTSTVPVYGVHLPFSLLPPIYLYHLYYSPPLPYFSLHHPTLNAGDQLPGRTAIKPIITATAMHCCLTPDCGGQYTPLFTTVSLAQQKSKPCTTFNITRHTEWLGV